MVARVVVVTGKPGIGKTTAVLKSCEILKDRKIKVGGFITSEKRTGGRRMGFEIIDLATGERVLLASETFQKGPRVGRYFVNLDFESLAIAALEKSLRESDVTVVDEIGPMELMGKRLVENLHRILPLGYSILATVHYSVKHPLITEVFRLAGPNRFTIELSNRDKIPQSIAEVLMGWLGQS